MTVTTSYGTWNNHGDRWNTTVEATIADAINGGDAEWREAMESTGALDLIAETYRQAINDALPDGVSLSGNDFYGPYDADDAELNIAEIIEGVDLNAIIERHDIPGALEAAEAAADEAEKFARIAESAAVRRAETVLAVVQACGSQVAAAPLLGIGQPTISRLIKKARDGR
ncbi:MAG TPA: LysR family transcriptional regulator [Actinocrinis sp.]|nr:LysR family transcriptional regulator [Actinocrinis sp.]